jgi:hypothetical protein
MQCIETSPYLSLVDHAREGSEDRLDDLGGLLKLQELDDRLQYGYSGSSLSDESSFPTSIGLK